MRNDITNARVKRSPNLLSVVEEGKAWRLVHFVLTHAGWFLSLLVGVIYILSPELRAVDPWIEWLLFCLAYLGVLEVLSRINDEFSGTPLIRMLRVQLVTLLVTTLFLLTGGSESYFWFVYLWPLFASALYFPRSAMWGICGEVVFWYFLASLAVAGNLALIDLTRLLTNLTVLLVLTVILRYLVESIRRYQAAERKLKYSEILQQIQEDIDTAVDLEDVLNRILRRAVELVGVKDGSLMLMGEKGELHFRARFGRSLPEGEVERTLKLGEGVAGWVVQSGRHYICHDAKTDAHFIPLPSKMTIRSLISVPILSHGTVLGVINVDSTEPGRFSEADADLLVTLANQTAVAIERAELLDSLRRISEKTLGSTEDLNEHIVDAVHRLTRCPVAMWQIDAKIRTQAKICAHRGLRKEYVRERALDLRHSVTGEAIRTAEPVKVVDIEEDQRVSPESKIEARRQGWKSMLVVPLLTELEGALGTLSIYSFSKKRFASWETDLLRSFASQAGVAMQNAERLQTIQRLNKEMTKRAEEMAFAHEVGKLLSDTRDIREIPRLLVKEALKAFNAEAGSLALIDTESKELEFQFAIEYIKATKVGQILRGYRIPLSKGIAGAVARSGEPIISNNIQADPRWHSEVDGITGFTTKSILAVPLIYSDQVIGVMEILNKRDGSPFLEREKDTLSAIASSAAIAIKNAHLFEDSRRRIRELEIVNDISQIIGAKLDIKDVLQTIVSQITDLLECTHCTIFFPQRENGQIVLVPEITAQSAHAEQIKTRRFRPGEPDEGLAGWVFRHGESLVLNDARKDDRFAPARKRQDRPRSMLVVPVKVANKTIGVISADQDELGGFNESDRRLVDALARQAGIAVERAASLELFQDVGNQIISLKKVGDILQQIVSGAIKLTNTDTGVIFLISEDGRSVLDRFYPPGFEHPEPRLSKGDGLTRHVIATGKVLSIPDIRQDPRVNPVLLDRFQAMIAVPLKIGQKVIGVLFLNAEDQHEFTETEISLLSALASQGAIAIENARLVNELTVLQNMSLDIARPSDLKQTLKDIVRRAVHLLGAYGGGMLLSYPPEKEVRMAFTHNLDVMRDFTCEFGEGMAGYVAESGKPLIVDDYQTWEHRKPGRGEDPYQHLLRAAVQVPISWENKVIGVLFVFDNRSDKKFSQRDLDRLKRVANLAALAIGNAREHSYLQSLVAISPDAIIVADRKGYITQFNEASEKIWGLAKEKVIGQHVAQYYYGGKEEARRVNHMLVESGDTGLRGYETFVRGKDGERIPIRLAGMVLRDETGRPIGSFGVQTDLREKTALLKSQCESEFLAELEHYPQDKPILDRPDLRERLVGQLNMTRQFCQSEYLVLFASIKEDETILLAIACSEGVPPHVASNLPHFNWRKAELQPWHGSQDETLKYEIDLITAWGPDQNVRQRMVNGIRGGRRDFFSNAAYMVPLRLADNYRSVLVFGPFTGEIDVARDAEFLKNVSLTISISALSWLQTLYLRTGQKEAKTSAKLITHRTLMNLMQVNGKFGLIKRLTNKDSSAYVEATEGERVVKQLSRSVHRAFTSGVVDMEAEDYSFQMYSLAALVQNCVESVRQHAEKKGRELRIDPSIENLPYAEVDPTMLFIALGNLVDNALKYSFEDTYIHVKSEYDTKLARITISDVGKRMPEEARANLSTPGRRWVVGADARRIPGMGLGLWEASIIAKVHGGKASFSSVRFPKRGRNAYLVSVWMDLPFRRPQVCKLAYEEVSDGNREKKDLLL